MLAPLRWLRRVFGIGSAEGHSAPASKDSDCTAKPSAPDASAAPAASAGSVKSERPPRLDRVFYAPAAVERSQRIVEVYVGLDFGTSTTKCLVSAVDPQGRTETHVVPLAGGYLFPSVAWESAGTLYPGHQRPDGNARAFRYAKVCLRCGIVEAERAHCVRCFDGTTLSAEHVVWFLLSYVVLQIRAYVRQRFGKGASIVEWKIGAPLDGLEYRNNTSMASLGDLFRDLLYRAVHSQKHGVQPAEGPTPVDDVVRRYGHIKGIACPLKASESDCFVIPEAIAIVQAVRDSEADRAGLGDGLYYVADAGAGTLDMTFFRYWNRGERPIAPIFALSKRIGGDDFARSLARHNGSVRPVALDHAREGLDRGDHAVLSKIENPDLPVLANEIIAVLRRFQKALCCGFENAVRREQPIGRWNGLQGIVIGGASRIPRVEKALLSGLGGNPAEIVHPRHYPLREFALANASPLHRVAHGLCVPRTRYVEWWHEQPPVTPANEEDDRLPPGHDPYADVG